MMNFRNRNKRFGNRFRQAGRYSSGGGASRGRQMDAGVLKGMIQEHYQNYKDSLQLHTRTAKERLILLGLSAFTATLGFGLVLVILFSIFLPSVRNTDKLLGAESTKIYDVNGKVLYTVNGEENRENIPSEQIPEVVKQATIAIEDDRFYKHNGIDLGGILKAMLSELGIGSPRGGSTITQQFIKNAVLSSERTYTRKLKEIILASRLERRYSKDDILTMYLNKIPYGGTAYGVEKAAETFFNKKAKDLELPEAVVLASLPNAPTYFSPFGNHVYTTLDKDFTTDELKKRKIKKISDLYENEYSYGLIGQNITLANGETIYMPGRVDEVLKKMEDMNYITEDEKNAARLATHEIVFPPYRSSIKAPHFVFYVKELLELKYGKEMVENGGLRVFTTLDYDLQTEAEKIVAAQAPSNASRFKANNLALVSIEPTTGYVKAMVGSADYFNQEINGSVNMTTSLRQPGSSFKPIVYATAFKEKVGPGTVLYDVPTKLGEDTPKNYDGGFVGPISVRRALGQSRNIPAIKAYYLAGQQDAIITQAELMGITTLDRRVDYGWPLSLGSGEVKMIDMAEAFGVFANGGYRVDVNPILKVEDKNGKILEDYTKAVPKKVQALDPQIAYLVSNILSDKTVNLGSALNLTDGRVAAVKTGTSTKRLNETEVYPSNLWTVGYTPDLVTAVWAGNSDGTEMALNADGYNAAVPVWNKFMTFALKEKPKVDFKKPKGIVSVQVSKLSGKLPNKHTPDNLITTDIFASFNAPTETDDSFFVATVDDRNNKNPNKYCPQDHVKEIVFWNPKSEIPGFLNWDGEVAAWFTGLDEEKRTAFNASYNLGDNIRVGHPVDEESELCREEYANKSLSIAVTAPASGDEVPRGTQPMEVAVEAEAGIDRVEYYLEDSIQYTATSAPYNGNVRIPPTMKTGQLVNVKVKLVDVNGYTKDANLQLRIGTGNRVEAPADLPAGIE